MDVALLVTISTSAVAVVGTLIAASWKIGKWFGNTDNVLTEIREHHSEAMVVIEKNSKILAEQESNLARMNGRVSSDEQAIINLNTRMNRYDGRLDDAVSQIAACKGATQ